MQQLTLTVKFKAEQKPDTEFHLKNFLEGEEKEIYRNMDYFLVETQSIDGEQYVRSLARLNEDRRIFVKQMHKSQTRLINFVLDLVQSEVEKKLEKWDETAAELEDGWGNYTVCLPWELEENKKDISTIINNLRV